MEKLKISDIKNCENWDCNDTEVIEYSYKESECTCEEPICRCRKIVNAKVSDFNAIKFTEFIAKRFFTKKNQTDMILYVINRIIRTMEISLDDFFINIYSGYYGERIDSVDFTKKNEFCDTFMDVWKQDEDIEKLKKLLELEYGYLIPKVERAKNCEIKSISPKKIRIQNDKYFRRLSNSIMKEYEEFPYLIGVVDENMNIIDGYHRYCSNKDRKKVKVLRIW